MYRYKLSVYVYLYKQVTCIYSCIYTHVYVFIRGKLSVYMYVYIQVKCIYTCILASSMYIYMCTYIYNVYIYVYIQVDCIYICIHIHVNIYVCGKLRVDLNPLKKKATSSQLRNVMIHFPTLFLKWYQKHVKVRFWYLLWHGNLGKGPRTLRKIPQKCQKIAGC